jgi:hypothetical protein
MRGGVARQPQAPPDDRKPDAGGIAAISPGLSEATPRVAPKETRIPEGCQQRPPPQGRVEQPASRAFSQTPLHLQSPRAPKPRDSVLECAWLDTALLPQRRIQPPLDSRRKEMMGIQRRRSNATTPPNHPTSPATRTPFLSAETFP